MIIVSPSASICTPDPCIQLPAEYFQWDSLVVPQSHIAESELICLPIPAHATLFIVSVHGIAIYVVA